jgi:hypothetical protein
VLDVDGGMLWAEVEDEGVLEDSRRWHCLGRRDDGRWKFLEILLGVGRERTRHTILLGVGRERRGKYVVEILFCAIKKKGCAPPHNVCHPCLRCEMRVLRARLPLLKMRDAPT